MQDLQNKTLENCDKCSDCIRHDDTSHRGRVIYYCKYPINRGDMGFKTVTQYVYKKKLPKWCKRYR
jgi:hypothetical protein